MDKINLPAALSTIAETWDPHVAGSVGDTHVRIARIEGAFDWHAHADEDEAFYVIRGSFALEFRDRTVPMAEGDFIVVPKGTEHRPVAPRECWIMLIEPAKTVNTGAEVTARTRQTLKPVTQNG